MNRVEHTNDVVPRIAAEIEKLNTDGSLPPEVKLVPYYDRTTLVNVTTHTVLHNLIFGCLLVFFHSVDLSRRSAQRDHRRDEHSDRTFFCHHLAGAPR
jgi:hypothetical protein